MWLHVHSYVHHVLKAAVDMIASCVGYCPEEGSSPIIACRLAIARANGSAACVKLRWRSRRRGAWRRPARSRPASQAILRPRAIAVPLLPWLPVLLLLVPTLRATGPALVSTALPILPLVAVFSAARRSSLLHRLQRLRR